MTQQRVEVTLDGNGALVLATERSVSEIADDLGLADGEVLVLVRGVVWRWLAPAETIIPAAGWDLRRHGRLRYVPNAKHKRTPTMGVKGTLCPNVDAQGLLDQSYQLVDRATRRWVVLGGCAFEAKYDNAGGWHGYPIRYRLVPAAIWRLWVVDGKSTAADWASDRLCEG